LRVPTLCSSLPPRKNYKLHQARKNYNIPIGARSTLPDHLEGVKGISSRGLYRPPLIGTTNTC
jgi:hypothetical protein